MQANDEFAYRNGAPFLRWLASFDFFHHVVCVAQTCDFPPKTHLDQHPKTYRSRALTAQNTLIGACPDGKIAVTHHF